MIRPVLAEAGAPVGQLPEEPEALLALGVWAQQWFSSMLRSCAGDGSGVSGFVQEKPQLRLGGAWAADRPDAPGYSPSADALLHSVALDLAFLVIEAARVQRPELAWQVVHDEERERFAVTVEQSSPPFPVLRLIRDFLVQSGARPRGLRGRELRDWRSGTLYRCYERAATGKAQISESQAFPGAAEHREGSSYLLRRPKREDPPASAELVAMVAAFRQAGWFEAAKVSSTGQFTTRSSATKLTDADLARAAQASWQAFEHEAMPADPVQAARRLLVLDGGRTWSEDVEADARPGDNLHEQTLFAIARIVGKDLGNLRDATEDWQTSPGDVQLSFWLGRGHHQILLPSPEGYLSPALFTGLNELLPEGRPRLWYADHGPPVAVVTRATAAEKDALQNLTGIELSPDPPGWWSKLAPPSR